MNKTLLIVFVKNIKLGKVKTRLAKTIGNDAAFLVYKELVAITEKATKELPIDTHIYFSDAVVNTKWGHCYKTVQQGTDLGERMLNAFQDGFHKGYQRIVLIGSDLPSLTSDIILEGFKQLEDNQIVFGPAKDGGYYLVGMNSLVSEIFIDKPWSTSALLEITLQQLKKTNLDVALIKTLNDIDTFEDLKQYPEFLKLINYHD